MNEEGAFVSSSHSCIRPTNRAHAFGSSFLSALTPIAQSRRISPPALSSRHCATPSLPTASRASLYSHLQAPPSRWTAGATASMDRRHRRSQRSSFSHDQTDPLLPDPTHGEGRMCNGVIGTNR